MGPSPTLDQSDQQQQEQKQPPARQKRCRTGCLKCRSRRRKCDEGKPRCHNCISKNFECRYATPLTFLEKNARTVSTPKAAPAAAPLASYKSLRFVNEIPQDNATSEPSTPDADTEQSPNRPSEPPLQSAFEAPTQSPGVILQPLVHQLPIDLHHEASASETWPADVPHPLHQHQNGLQPDAEQRENTIVFGERYESAVHGLIALGNSHGTFPRTPGVIASPELVRIDEPASHSFPMPQHSMDLPTPVHMEHSLVFSPLAERETGVFRDQITPERTLELLRHYRYEVAPWLDMCDMAQPFGIIVPQLTVGSDMVFFTVLALAASSTQGLSSNKPHDMDLESRNLINLSDEQRMREAQTPTRRILGSMSSPQTMGDVQSLAECTASVLRTAWNFLSGLSTSWRQGSIQAAHVQDISWLSASHTGLEPALYWLLLRLELSSALMNSQPVHIPILNIPFPPLTDISGRLLRYAYRALTLCIRAVNISYGESESPFNDAPRKKPIERWKCLLDELELWWKGRPEEFLPAVEMEAGRGMIASDASFPVVIFTNGSGIFGNQLYHTAMLQLLLNKPRTFKLAGVRSITSPLWHAERLCGIALNNDRRDCWDPCLLASLLVAAQRMTHESQQRALLDGFQRIQRLTGFDIKEPLVALREVWDPWCNKS